MRGRGSKGVRRCGGEGSRRDEGVSCGGFGGNQRGWKVASLATERAQDTARASCSTISGHDCVQSLQVCLRGTCPLTQAVADLGFGVLRVDILR